MYVNLRQVVRLPLEIQVRCVRAVFEFHLSIGTQRADRSTSVVVFTPAV